MQGNAWTPTRRLRDCPPKDLISFASEVTTVFVIVACTTCVVARTSDSVACVVANTMGSSAQVYNASQAQLPAPQGDSQLRRTPFVHADPRDGRPTTASHVRCEEHRSHSFALCPRLDNNQWRTYAPTCTFEAICHGLSGVLGAQMHVLSCMLLMSCRELLPMATQHLVHRVPA